jgi:hypothetical protein
VKRLLLIAFFFEIGFALLVVPWSAFWDRNYFAEALPWIHPFITNNFVRGAVSGLGLVNIFTGLGEIVSILLARNMESPTTPFTATPLTKD